MSLFLIWISLRASAALVKSRDKSGEYRLLFSGIDMLKEAYIRRNSVGYTVIDIVRKLLSASRRRTCKAISRRHSKL
jgi:hypothetical protein